MTFNSVRRPNAVLGGPAGEAGIRELAGQGLTVDYADRARSGDFFKLTPTSSFKAIKPGERRKVAITIELWATHKTDAPAGYAISFGVGPANWVPARKLLDPTDPKQTTARPVDVRPVETAASRFGENTAPRVDLDLKNRLVPQPLSATAQAGSLSAGSPVGAPGSLRKEAGYLKSALGDISTERGAPIGLRVDPRLDVDRDGKADSEGYTLRTSGGGVEIVGTDGAGVLYGIQTLRQLIPAESYKAAAGHRRQPTVRVPRAAIADAPKYGYRGLQLDVSRHFMSVTTVKKFLDLMAFTKLNALHFGLANDEGWRLAIPGLPELTEFGARKTLDPAERTALHQGMGSGNDLGDGDGVGGKADDQTAANLGRTPTYQGFEQGTLNFVGPGAGFYTVDDFRNILRYADERHIQVIPEFDLPAHARGRAGDGAPRPARGRLLPAAGPREHLAAPQRAELQRQSRQSLHSEHLRLPRQGRVRGEEDVRRGGRPAQAVPPGRRRATGRREQRRDLVGRLPRLPEQPGDRGQDRR